MAGKSLTIKFLIDNAQARAANRQAMSDFAAQSRAADATAASQTKASNKAATAAVASGKRITDDATKRVALIDRIETKFAADDYRRRVKSERDAITSRQRATDATVRQADRAAKAQQKADDMAAASAKRQADRAIKEAQRKADAIARSDARQAANEQRQTARREQQQIASDKRVEKSRVDSAWRAYAQREKAEEKAAAAQHRTANIARQSAQEQAASQGLVSNATLGAAGAVVGLAASYLSLNGVRKIMEDLADATRQAYDVQKALSDEVGRQRDAARELRSMEGNGATTKGTIKDAEFGAKTGMKMDEVQQYKAAFMGSGAQFEGKTMSKEQFAKFQQNSARLTTAKGIDPAVMGDLAGKVVGMKDYSKLGDKAADAALGDLNQLVAVMQHGSGNNKQLVENLSKFASFAFNEDEMLGVFNSHKEMASALSIAAEVSPGESEVYTRNAAKAIRGFGDDDKQAPLLKKAGIDASTPFFEAFEKLGPIIKKEAKDRGLKTYDIIKENFGDEREQKAVGAYINKGVGPNGAIKERLNFADTVAGPSPAFDEINKFENDPDSAGVQRKGEAANTLANMKRGAKSLQAENLFSFAEADLQEKGEIDTTKTNKEDYWQDKFVTAFGLAPNARPGARKSRIIGQTLARLEAKSGEKGVDFDPFQFYEENGASEDVLTARLNEKMVELEKQGVDVFGAPVGPYRGKEHADRSVATDAIPLSNAIKAMHKDLAKPPMPRPLPQGKPAGQGRRP